MAAGRIQGLESGFGFPPGKVTAVRPGPVFLPFQPRKSGEAARPVTWAGDREMSKRKSRKGIIAPPAALFWTQDPGPWSLDHLDWRKGKNGRWYKDPGWWKRVPRDKLH